MLGERVGLAGGFWQLAGGAYGRVERRRNCLGEHAEAPPAAGSEGAQSGHRMACERKKGHTEAWRAQQKHQSCRRERAGWGASRGEDGGPRVGLVQS